MRFVAAAELAEADNDVDSSAALKYASTHWLRHTMLTTHENNACGLENASEHCREQAR